MSDPRRTQAELDDVEDEVFEDDAPDPVEDEGEETEETETEDAAGETESEGEADGEQPPPRQPTRAEREIIRLRKRAQEAERERDEERARNRAPAAPQPKVETEEERELRLSQLDPETRHRVEMQELRRDFSQRLTQSDRIAAARADKASFENLMTREPYLERVKDEVETEFQNTLSRGGFIPRETLADYFIGKRARAAAARNRGKQTRRGREAIARETTRPPRSGSDVQPQRRAREDSKEARDRRLENMKI